MKKIMALVVSFISLAGCAYNPPTYNAASPANSDNKIVLNSSPDKVFNRSLTALASDGYQIKVADKQNGIITTEKKLVRLNEEQADCGNIWGISYVKDTRTATYASYSLLLSPAGDKTEVMVNTHIEGLFNSSAMEQSTKQLACHSSGYLEKALIERLRKE